VTTSCPYNDRFPTDPTTWAVLLILAALAIGRLDPEQVQVLSTLAQLTPLLLLGRR
jgi:hypothetical protein